MGRLCGVCVLLPPWDRRTILEAVQWVEKREGSGKDDLCASPAHSVTPAPPPPQVLGHTTYLPGRVLGAEVRELNRGTLILTGKKV